MASAPPPFLLSILKRKLFGSVMGGPASFDEPDVATFSRALVDNNNNLLLTQAQIAAVAAMASGAGIPLSFPIPQGQDFVQVTGLALGFTPTKCVPTVMKGSGDLNIGASCRYLTLTSNGFYADLTGITDTDDYVLSFVLS